MKYKILSFAFALFGCHCLVAQSISSSVISPMGTSFKQDGFGLHFSIGEPLNTMIEGTESSISQGVLQMPSTSTNNGNTQASGAAPTITCPQTTVINICAPVGSPAAMAFSEFNPVDDQTASANIAFDVVDEINTQEALTTITRQYIFTDEDGNSTSCEMVYHITNQFMEAPVIAEQPAICADDFFAGIKLGSANYRVYTNQNGSMGSLVNICDKPGLLCSAGDLGIDATVAGNKQLWVTEFINFPDGSICESPASVLNLEVLEKPSAQLSEVSTTIQNGEVLDLMDFVALNPNGYWSGEGVFSIATADGSPLWIFSGNETGAKKLYYTVSNQICTESYLLVVNVEDLNTCDSNTGTFFYAFCGGISYYFIELEDGRIFDPYFAVDPGYFPYEGQQIRFDYEIKTDVTTPCTISESPITITCFETITPGVFANRPVPINNNQGLVSPSVQLYPNPVVDYLNLNIADVHAHNYQIQLFSMNGALLKEAVVNQPVQSVDLSAFNAGNYIMHLIKNDITVDFMKVVKQ